MTRPIILFRADASEKLGLGHVARSLNLAEKLTGFRPVFMTRATPAARRFFQGRKVCLEYLRSETGVGQEIALLARLQEKYSPAVTLLDLLHYPGGYVAAIRRAARRLVTFYEQAPSDKCSDMVVNCNPFYGYELFRGRPGQLACVGPRFVIIRDSFFKARSGTRASKASRKIRTVLITMGGSDPKGLTIRALKALQGKKDYRFIVHCGPAFSHVERLKAFLSGRSLEVEVRKDLKETADLFKEADMAVCSGGNSMYELCFLGVPALVVAQNAHQYEFARGMERAGCVLCAGRFPGVTASSIREGFERVTQDAGLRREMAEKGRRLIDGLGARRIGSTMLGLVSGGC